MASNQLAYPYSRANLAVAVSFATVSLASVVLRFVARYISRAKFGLDDYLIVVVLLLIIGASVMASWASEHGGLGVPLQDLNSSVNGVMLKESWVQEVIITPAVGLVKICVCLFYKRIFTVPRFKMAANIVIVVTVCWTIAFTVCLAVNFVPYHLEWTLEPITSHDLNLAAMLITMATSDLLLDLVIFSLPIPMVRGLHLPTRKRVYLHLIFGLGVFCIVATLVRLVYIIKFMSSTSTNSGFSEDEHMIGIWSNIEPCVSIVCACLPTYGPLFRASNDKSTGVRFADSWPRLSWFHIRNFFRGRRNNDAGDIESTLAKRISKVCKRNELGEIMMGKEISVLAEIARPAPVFARLTA